MPPKKEHKAREFRGKLPSGKAKGSVKRHKLSCEIMATAVNHTSGPKMRERKTKVVTKAISGPDNVHTRGGRKKNKDDHKVDRKLIDAYKKGTRSIVAKRDIPHLQAGADVAYRHRKEIGIGVTRTSNKIYSTAITSEGKRAVRIKKV